MRRHVSLLAILTLLVGGCAPTNSTGTLPIEVLVVLDSTERSLALVPVDSARVEGHVPLGDLDFVPRFVAARGRTAVVAGTNPETLVGGVAIVDLESRAVTTRQLSLGRVAAVIMSDDDIAYVASWSTGIVSRIDVASGETQVLTAPGGPQGLTATRGKVFAAIGNRQGCDVDPVGCGRGPSWLLQIEPGLPRDSIPISGPGNAGPIATGADGNVYVLVPGDAFAGGEGRLDVIDAVRSVELASFARVGPVEPAWITSDGIERVLFVSEPGGLMVFNTRERRLTLPFGSGIPLAFPAELVTDALGRAYVVERGGCSGAAPGRIRVFSQSLVERPQVAVGPCPVAAAVAEVAADRLFGSTID